VSWTPDRKETLRLMWVEGKTSRQIAEALGDVTRNAVMGMVNRMGLMGNKDHNALIKSAHGACRPIGLDEEADGLPAVGQAVEEPRHDPVPSPSAQPAEPAPLVAEDVHGDTPEQTARPRQKLASRLLGPLRRAVAPDRAPAPAAAYVAPGAAPVRSGRERRPDWRTAVSMVEEILGTPYSPGAKGHRTSLVAIAAILGGGNPQSILPWDFPKPFTLKTMRSLAEKGIMTGGSTPEAWLDPDLGDLNFFIDMLVAEGVMTGTRTSSTPATMTA
jgi:hypothetical protein